MFPEYKRRNGYNIVYSYLLLLTLLESQTICSELPHHYWDNPYLEPYFDNTTRRDVTVTVGQTALLHCKVKNLGDRAVSWIRKRDLHLLTVGILTYTSDQRFQSLHIDGSEEWTLKISSPQPRDTGTYECQVSMEPKISQRFSLNVVVSRAKIIGNTELFIKSGSNINLTCVVMQSPVAPSFIYWYKGNRVLNYSQRRGINVYTERSTKTSRLLITKATAMDSGNYTCSPSNSGSASVIVHVINGEHPAAMQHGNSSASSLSSILDKFLMPYKMLPRTQMVVTTSTTMTNSYMICSFSKLLWNFMLQLISYRSMLIILISGK